MWFVKHCLQLNTEINFQGRCSLEPPHPLPPPQRGGGEKEGAAPLPGVRGKAPERPSGRKYLKLCKLYIDQDDKAARDWVRKQLKERWV